MKRATIEVIVLDNVPCFSQLELRTVTRGFHSDPYSWGRLHLEVNRSKWLPPTKCTLYNNIAAVSLGFLISKDGLRKDVDKFKWRMDPSRFPEAARWGGCP